MTQKALPTEQLEDDIEAAKNLIETVGENASLLVGRMQEQLTSVEIYYQIGAILAALLVGWLLARPFRRWIDRRFAVTHIPAGEVSDAPAEAGPGQLHKTLRSLAAPAISLLFLWLTIAAYSASDLGVSFMRIIASLLGAWVVIRLVSSVVRDAFWSSMIAAIAWIAAALNILRLLGPTIDFLDGLRLPGGGENAISVFDVFSAILVGAILLWGALIVSRFVQGNINRSTKLTPSVRGLLGQLIQIALIAGAIMIGLSAANVNLTGLAVLTGAIGVGIGFGLQSIFSNFIAGIIILLEKTLKVGDFVDLESGVTGEVKEINVRSTLVTTNDNVDILVPNSEFITNRVTNWTLREVYRRVHVAFGVAYGTDKDLVKKAALEAADNVPYTLKNNPKRAPQVWLVEFGDSSLNFELVVWLTDDAVRRPGAVNAAYNWEIETALGKYGIEIPFPQRDLHIIPPKDEKTPQAPAGATPERL